MRLLILLSLVVLLMGCAEKEVVKLEKNLEVRSVFKNGEFIPKKYTCNGEDVSPPLELVNLSPEAKSIAIIVEDPDAPMGTFTHWIIWNIPPTNEIPEGIPKGKEISEPFKAYQGRNDFGEFGYGGPCPPKGKPHRYVFKVYVLDTMLDLKDATKDELLKAMEGHIVQYGELVGLYGR
jgi:Raf kinase inhibitor-like YbhB/YbcL family protein